jgi:hypothetical protein
MVMGRSSPLYRVLDRLLVDEKRVLSRHPPTKEMLKQIRYCIRPPVKVPTERSPQEISTSPEYSSDQVFHLCDGFKEGGGHVQRWNDVEGFPSA